MFECNLAGSVDLLLINFGNAVKGDSSHVPLAGTNNRLFDYGAEGMKYASKSLDDSGIDYIVTGNNGFPARQTESSDINDNVTVISYDDSNNFKKYGTDVMPQDNGSDYGYLACNNKFQTPDAKTKGSDNVVVLGYLPYFGESGDGTDLLSSLSFQCDDFEMMYGGADNFYFNLTGDTNES